MGKNQGKEQRDQVVAESESQLSHLSNGNKNVSQEISEKRFVCISQPLADEIQ